MKKDRSLRIVAAGHAFIQNLRRGHYELATDATTLDRVAVGSPSSPSRSDQPGRSAASGRPPLDQRNSADHAQDAGPTQAVSTGVRVGVRRRGAGPPAIRIAPLAPHVGQVHSRRRRSGERDSAAGSPQHGQAMCSSSWWGSRTVTRTGVSMPSRRSTRAKPRLSSPAGLRCLVAAAGGCEPSRRPEVTGPGPDVARGRRRRPAIRPRHRR